MILVSTAALACSESTAPVSDTITPEQARLSSTVQCDPDNAGLTLPAGFCALVVANITNSSGAAVAARHLVVLPSGEIFVAVNAPRNVQPEFGIIGLRDTTGDGKADVLSRFSPGLGGSGIAYRSAQLYFGANDRVLRFQLPAGLLTPVGNPETIVSGLPNTGDHISKTIVLDGRTNLIVNIGSASNACQVQNRVAQSPGVFPCPELPVRAGVWTFDATRLNQTQSDGHHFATDRKSVV